MGNILGYLILFPVFFLLIIGCYQWIKFLRNKALNNILLIKQQIKILQQDVNRFDQQKESLSSYKQEPYGKFVVSLQEQLSNTHTLIQEINSKQRQLLRSIPPRNSNPFYEVVIFIKKKEGKKWKKVELNVRMIYDSLDDLTIRIRNISDQLAEIKQIPWQTSKFVLKINNSLQEIKSIIINLLQNNVWGPMINDGQARLDKMQNEIINIPGDYYRNGVVGRNKYSEPDLISITILSFEILKRIDNPCNNLYHETVKWKSDYDNSCKAVERAEKALFDTQKKAVLLPRLLDLREEKIQISELTKSLEELVDNQKKPTIENLINIIDRGSQIEQEASKFLLCLAKYDEQYKKLIDEVNQVFNHVTVLQSEFDTQTHQVKYPINWNLSQEKLDLVLKQWKSIEPLESTRTPNKVINDLSTLTGIQAELSSLEKTYSAMIGRIKFLREEGSENATQIWKPTWMQNVDDLIRAIGSYSIENWGPKDHIANLAINASDLIHRSQLIIPNSESAPLNESEIPRLYNDLSNLTRDIRDFEGRRRNIQSSLKIMQEKERAARHTILKILPILNAVTRELIQRGLSTDMISDWLHLVDRGENLKSEILRSQIGRILEKYQDTEKWKQEILQKGQSFIADLNEEISNQKNQIEERIVDLGRIARTVKHPYIQQAEISIGMVYAVDVVNIRGLENIYEQIKNFLQMRDEIIIVAQNLYDTTSTLLTTYDLVIQEREAAEKLLRHVKNQMDRMWPPVFDSARVENENNILQDIGKHISVIQTQRQPVENLEIEYLEVLDMYREVSRDLRQIIKKDKERQEPYINLKEKLRNRLRMRIQEQVILEQNTILTDEQTILLESLGLELVDRVKSDYKNGDITAIEAEKFIDGLFLSGNIRIDFQNLTLQIETEGGPIFMGPVDNRGGKITGRKDTR